MVVFYVLYLKQIQFCLPASAQICMYKTSIGCTAFHTNMRKDTHLWMRLVSGSINFLPSLGSSGVKAPNCNEDSGAL